MTKYSKITKSSFAILALSLILVAVLAFGGTYAYFTAKATKNGTITMGKLGLGDITLTVQTDEVVPGQDALTAPITFSSSAETNVPMIMLAKIEITDNTAEAADIIASAGVNSTWEAVDEHPGFYAYKGTDYKTNGAASQAFTLVDHVYVDRTNGNDIMGKTLTVTVTVWAMQADWVSNANGTATQEIRSAADVYTVMSTYYTIGGADAIA